MPALYVLYETAAGYSLFEVTGVDELGQSADAVQQSTVDLTRFGKVVKLQSFAPFTNAAHALDEMNAISEAVLTDDLKTFLETNLPQVQISCTKSLSCNCMDSRQSCSLCIRLRNIWILHGVKGARFMVLMVAILPSVFPSVGVLP